MSMTRLLYKLLLLLPLNTNVIIARLVAHAVQVLHREVVDIEESLDAVGKASLLALVQLVVLDAALDALVPAHLGQAVGLGLDLRALLLVGEELAQLVAIVVAELLEVGVVDGDLLGTHLGGLCVCGT